MFFTRILFMVCALSFTAAAADPSLGAWKRNVAQSKSSSGEAVTPGTATIEAIPDGYRITSSLVATPFIRHLDGKDYRDNTKAFAETSGAGHSNARRSNDRTIETTFKRNGKAVGTIRRAVSADGRVLTPTIDGVSVTGEKVNSVTVSDKQ